MHPSDLPRVGARHPLVHQVRQIAGNLGPQRHQLFVAEGLWAHRMLVELGARVDTFLWCPESGTSAEARALAARIAARSATAFRISERTLDRLRDRERPDGMISLVTVPTWLPADVPEVRFGGRTALVVGNERLGVCSGWRDLGLPRVTIPTHGRADSLNVAVSASVLLYAARVQRGGHLAAGHLMAEPPDRATRRGATGRVPTAHGAPAHRADPRRHSGPRPRPGRPQVRGGRVRRCGRSG